MSANAIPNFWAKVQQILTDSIAGLDPGDRATRIRHCQVTGRHGVSMHVEGEMVRFDWGGRTLAAVPREILADDATELPPPQFIPEVPDDPSGLPE